MIQAEHLTKVFHQIRAIQNISFQVKSGEALGLLGPNGAGKTTTMRILAGFFPPTSGRVLINGVDLFCVKPAIRKQIGYLPENAPLDQNLLTKDFLSYVAELKGVRRSDRKKELETVLEECRIGEMQNRLIGKLSKGFKQRIGLAQALIGKPSVFIFY